MTAQLPERRAFRPDPKPAARIVDPRAGVEKVRREGRCRLCGRRPSGHPLDSLNRMHIVPKGQRGDDLDANIIPGCGSGTTGCHGALTLRRDDPSGLTYAEACARLRKRMRPEESSYVLGKMGPDWLDRAYPAGDATPEGGDPRGTKV